MLGFLRKLFGKRPRPTIFQWFDGTRQRWSDAAALWDRLHREHHGWESVLQTVASGEENDRILALWELAQITRELFGVEEFHDTEGKPVGLTQTETVQLFYALISHLENNRIKGQLFLSFTKT